MPLADMREVYKLKEQKQRDQLRFLHESNSRHFRQEGDGPLQDITNEIKAEYERHIETYATLIAEIDAILGA